MLVSVCFLNAKKTRNVTLVSDERHQETWGFLSLQHLQKSRIRPKKRKGYQSIIHNWLLQYGAQIVGNRHKAKCHEGCSVQRQSDTWSCLEQGKWKPLWIIPNSYPSGCFITAVLGQSIPVWMISPRSYKVSKANTLMETAEVFILLHRLKNLVCWYSC